MFYVINMIQYKQASVSLFFPKKGNHILFVLHLIWKQKERHRKEKSNAHF